MLDSLKQHCQSVFPSLEPWSNRRLAMADRLGLFAVLLMALTGLWAGGLYRLSLLLLVIAFLVAAVDFWPRMSRSVVFWLAAGFVAFAAARYWIAVVELGFDQVGSPPRTSQFVRSSPLLALMAAVWIRGEQKRLLLLMMAAGLGATAWVVTGTHWDAFLEMLRGWDWSSARRSLHESSTNRVPLILLMIGLGLATAGVGGAARMGRKWLRIGLVSTTAAFAMAFFALTLAIETRQTQLGAVVGFGIALSVVGHHALRALGLPGRARLALTGLGAIVLIGIASAALVNSSATNDRLQRTVEAARVLVENPEYLRDPFAAANENRAIHRGRVVQRLNLLNLGAEAVAEKPLVGWGGGTNHRWIREYGRTDFHNWYLEVAVAFGLMGALLYFGGFAYLAGSTARATRRKIFPGPVALFALSATAALVTTQLFTTSISSSQGRFIVIFLAALLAVSHTTRWWPKPKGEVSE